MTPKHERRARRDGFTLIELMIAIGVGAMVISGVYLVSRGSTRIFHEEQRIASAQLDLRLAMEMLRADLQRAAFLATPNSTVDPDVCPKPATALHAVRLFDGEGAGRVNLPAQNAFLAPDRVMLLGSYVDNDVYFAQQIVGSTITLNTTTRSYEKFLADPTLFGSVFANTNFLRIYDPSRPSGGVQFVGIASANLAAGTITTATPVTLTTGGSDCGVTGVGVGAQISAVTFIDYRVDNISATAPAAYPDLAGTAGAIGRTDLIRRRMRMDRTPIAGSDRIVAAYVIDFNVDFITDDQPNPPPAEANLVPKLGAAAAAIADGSATARPQAIRAAIVRLSVRSRDEDPTFEFVARASALEMLTRYKVSANSPWATHVRTLRTEVALANLANRGLR